MCEWDFKRDPHLILPCAEALSAEMGGRKSSRSREMFLFPLFGRFPSPFAILVSARCRCT